MNHSRWCGQSSITGNKNTYALIWLVLLIIPALVDSYERKPCTHSIRPQFQFPDCYVPDLNPSQLLSSASFLLSHDSATGYFQKGFPSSVISLYAKNQIGTVYDQLNDGARALDVRPKLLHNGTVVLQHGAITIPVSLERLVMDALKWCTENPDELVLIFHSNMAYEFSNVTNDGGESALTALSQVYETLGVPYVECGDVYGLTVEETMELAVLPNNGGYLLALDRHDFYSSFCGKMNWVKDQLVTCYPNGTLPCTNKNSPVFDELREYILASANNQPSDDFNTLGPPASLDTYPFNEIQALWQVDGHSAAMGISKLSSLIDDNTKSQINAKLVDMIYEQGEFQATSTISLLAVDHVRLNGNALLSVLRTACGQSDLDECGEQISKPRMQRKPMSTLSFFVTVAVYAAFFVWMSVLARHYFQYYQHEKQMKRMEQDIKVVGQHLKAALGGGGEFA
jgi:hypothetical protein